MEKRGSELANMIKLGPIGNVVDAVWDGKGKRDLYQLFISYENVKLVGLQFQYIDEESSSLVMSEVYGRMSGPNFRAIKFDYPSEYITWLRIDGGYSGVTWIAMKTNLGKCYGPFPNQSQIVEISNKMLATTGYYLGEDNQFGGFHGTADKVHGLRSLGVYVQPVSSLDMTVADIQSHDTGGEDLEVD